MRRAYEYFPELSRCVVARKRSVRFRHTKKTAQRTPAFGGVEHEKPLRSNRGALNSAWVLKEATILAWRAALDKQKFKLFVVQMQDVAGADLHAAKFDPLMLNLMQRVTICSL
jgi:hypothetical protein